jgi:hypothetical protein
MINDPFEDTASLPVVDLESTQRMPRLDLRYRRLEARGEYLSGLPPLSDSARLAPDLESPHMLDSTVQILCPPQVP